MTFDAGTTTILIAIVGAAVAIIGSTWRMNSTLRADVADLAKRQINQGERLARLEQGQEHARADLASVAARQIDQGERLARLEGPWRPAPPSEPAAAD